MTGHPHSVKPAVGALGLALLGLAVSVSAAASGATLRGRVVVQGSVPQALSFGDDYGSADTYGYEERDPPAELPQQLIVYLLGVPLRPTGTRAVLSQRHRNFTASIVPVLPGQKLDIRNDDIVRHHVRSSTKPWDFNIKARPPGSTVTCDFGAAPDGGLGVVPVYCDIHPYMHAHVLVMPTPVWKLLPETGGSFEFKGLPAGAYTLAVWHPVLRGAPCAVVLKRGQTKTVTLVLRGDGN